jgi:hypothetical protein
MLPINRLSVLISLRFRRRFRLQNRSPTFCAAERIEGSRSAATAALTLPPALLWKGRRRD